MVPVVHSTGALLLSLAAGIFSLCDRQTLNPGLLGTFHPVISFLVHGNI